MTNDKCKWCEKQAVSRGVCAKHYARCALLVSFGETWESVLSGDEPMPGKRGRPVKTGSASWLAEKYDELAADVARAIELIDAGQFAEARAVISGQRKNEERHYFV